MQRRRAKARPKPGGFRNGHEFTVPRVRRGRLYPRRLNSRPTATLGVPRDLQRPPARQHQRPILTDPSICASRDPQMATWRPEPDSGTDDPAHGRPLSRPAQPYVPTFGRSVTWLFRTAAPTHEVDGVRTADLRVDLPLPRVASDRTQHASEHDFLRWSAASEPRARGAEPAAALQVTVSLGAAYVNVSAGCVLTWTMTTTKRPAANRLGRRPPPPYGTGQGLSSLRLRTGRR
jgi:hypothetical protein